MALMRNVRLGKDTKLNFKVIRTALNRVRNVICLFIIIHILGGLLFWIFEREQGLTLFHAQYWASVTGYTVGYGEIVPKTDPGRALTMVYIPTMQLLWVVLGAIIIATVIAARNTYAHEEQERDEAAMMVLLKMQGLIPEDSIELPSVEWFQQHHNFKPSQDEDL